jgi:hypothetical protein
MPLQKSQSIARLVGPVFAVVTFKGYVANAATENYQ